MTLSSKNQKFLILEFSKPVSLHITSEPALWGKIVEYKFHIGVKAEDKSRNTFLSKRPKNKDNLNNAQKCPI